jgi:hypothetical protein
MEKKGKIISKEERKTIAFHEAGHAIAGWLLEHADPLLKVTIIPRSSGALGFAQYLPKEVSLHTTEQLRDMMCMALGGRAAEDIAFGKVTTGASDDLRRVTAIATSMVQIYGMSDKLGQVSYPPSGNEMEMTKPCVCSVAARFLLLFVSSFSPVSSSSSLVKRVLSDSIALASLVRSLLRTLSLSLLYTAGTRRAPGR